MGILILGYNKEYDCKFALTSIRKRPPDLNDDLSVWEGKTISISVHPELLKNKAGTDNLIRVFNFRGFGYTLDDNVFQSVSEYVSTLPKYIIFYILFLLFPQSQVQPSIKSHESIHHTIEYEI